MAVNQQSGGRAESVRLDELGRDQLDRDEMIAALARITASERFRKSERIRDFLGYVVAETLDGRGALIKAHSIAVDVFRRQNFADEAGDAIVRTSAHRLRLFLEGYYHDEGAGDPYRIVLPKGTYVPKFYAVSFPAVDHNVHDDSLRGRDQGSGVLGPAASGPLQDKGARHPWRRSIMIWTLVILLLLAGTFVSRAWLGDTASSDRPRLIVTTVSNSREVAEALPAKLQRQLVSSLVSFGSVTIVDRAYLDARTDQKGLFKLNVALVASDGFVADWKLIDVSTGSIIWTGKEKLRSANYPALRLAASSIASATLGQEGAFAVWLGANTDEDDPRRCLSSAQMRSTLISDDSEKARRCLEAMTKTHPNDATVWALLSMTYYRLATGSAPWVRGEDKMYFALQKSALARAAKLNPDTYYTRLAQLFDAQARRDRDAFDASARRLLEHYGGDPSLRTQVAVKLVQAGRQEEGLKLIQSKAAMGVDLNAADKVALGLVHYFDGEYEKARPFFDRVSDNEAPLAVIIKVAIYGQLGLRDQARRSWSTLLKNYPDSPKALKEIVTRVSTPDDKAELILDGLRKAGVIEEGRPD